MDMVRLIIDRQDEAQREQEEKLRAEEARAEAKATSEQIEAEKQAQAAETERRNIQARTERFLAATDYSGISTALEEIRQKLIEPEFPSRHYMVIDPRSQRLELVWGLFTWDNGGVSSQHKADYRAICVDFIITDHGTDSVKINDGSPLFIRSSTKSEGPDYEKIAEALAEAYLNPIRFEWLNTPPQPDLSYVPPERSLGIKLPPVPGGNSGEWWANQNNRVNI